jgi:nicotinamide mononucleotide adenylyltransferase
MLLRQLFESKNDSVGIIFGRFNPPHQGHKAAWEMAAENDQWFVGTNQSTQGPKDPLPYDVKVKAMQAVYPEIKGHIVAEQSWLTLASKVYNEYGDAVLNVYTDEDWVTKTLIQYNGKEGSHGFYNFENIDQKPTPRLSSATALRAAVQADDRQAFSQAAGVDADTPVGGNAFFDVVKHYLMPHVEKAAAKPAKKKVKEPEQGVAEGAPIVVAQAPIHIRNPKKAPQPYRNKGDIVPDTKPPSTEKRGVKGRPGQRPMPKYDEGTGVRRIKDKE